MRTRIRLGALALALLGAFTSSSYAQSFEDKYESKLQKEFVKNAAWVLDLDEAKAAAKESNKLIFAYFTRSYSP